MGKRGLLGLGFGKITRRLCANLFIWSCRPQLPGVFPPLSLMISLDIWAWVVVP